MGLRDALRSLRGAAREQPADATDDVEVPEPITFRPRFDGYYSGARDPAAPGPVTALRFVPGRVFQTEVDDEVGPAAADEPGPAEDDPCQGEYTAAGRFTVQRKFERATMYAVLEADRDSFRARRISGIDGSTGEITFTFVERRPEEI